MESNETEAKTKIVWKSLTDDSLSVKIYIFFAGFWIQSVYESISSYFSWKKDEIIRWGSFALFSLIQVKRYSLNNIIEFSFALRIYFVHLRKQYCLHGLHLNKTKHLSSLFLKIPWPFFSFYTPHLARKLLIQQQPSRESIRKTDLNLFFFHFISIVA